MKLKCLKLIEIDIEITVDENENWKHTMMEVKLSHFIKMVYKYVYCIYVITKTENKTQLK